MRCLGMVLGCVRLWLGVEEEKEEEEGEMKRRG